MGRKSALVIQNSLVLIFWIGYCLCVRTLNYFLEVLEMFYRDEETERYILIVINFGVCQSALDLD